MPKRHESDNGRHAGRRKTPAAFELDPDRRRRFGANPRRPAQQCPPDEKSNVERSHRSRARPLGETSSTDEAATRMMDCTSLERSPNRPGT
jgi:hypothetical protein